MDNLGSLLAEKPSGYEEAENLYRKCLQIYPDNCDMLNKLAHHLQRNPSGYEESEKLLQRSMEIQPNNDDTLELMDDLNYLKSEKK
tara:strand:- start:1814 stop:2071 length:258 start_codon:yes stop_codon:yes gene_type:complete